MKIIVLDDNYPNIDNLYGNVFVHSRLLAYKKKNPSWDIIVISRRECSGNEAKNNYSYEGINVLFIFEKDLLEIHLKINPNVVLIHFFPGSILEHYIYKVTTPTIIWVHGIEALGWYRRLFNFSFSKNFAYFIYSNIKQLIKFRKLVKYANKKLIYFIFVSNWMKKVCEFDIISKVKKYKVIPNFIDTSYFSYLEKSNKDRLKVLLIRSFNSRKYANDIAINAIIELSSKEFFKNFEFTIVGSGYLFDKLTAPIAKFDNVKLINKFLDHENIKKLHDSNGIFLCPTRQDAQGVSMCEAMASGLVPITSKNTAIPEFVENNKSGFLTKSSKDIAKVLTFLFYNEQDYLNISQRASLHIKEICNEERTVFQEISLINIINEQ